MKKHQTFMAATCVLVALILLCGAEKPWAESPGDRQGEEKVPVGLEPVIRALKPDPRGGQAYQLSYVVGAPIDILWRFKTDFTNDIFAENEYILSHRYIGRHGDTVVTEIRYAQEPDVTFKWQTTVHSDIKRLDFILLEPQKSGERFNYGHIQLVPAGEYTKVIHVVHFDFFGAFIWAKYPWKGGMADFLRYMARWEQETVLRLAARYRETGLSGQKGDPQKSSSSPDHSP